MSETVEKILDVAEAEVRAKGYHAVSFRDLAEELGIKSASIHYHFRHKEDLGTALVKRYGDRFFSELESRISREIDSETRLKVFVDQYRKALKSSDAMCLCGILGAEINGLPVSLGGVVSEFFNRNFEFVEDVLCETMIDREKRSLARSLVSGLQGAMMLAQSLGDHSVFDEVADRLLIDVMRQNHA